METIRLICRPSDLGDSLNDATLSKSFADVLLCCPTGQKFLAHRNVLSAFSPYLRVLLTRSGLEPTRSLIPIKIEGPELAALPSLVYTGRTRLPADTLQIRLPIEQHRSDCSEAAASLPPRPRVANRVTASPWSQTLRPHHSPKLQPILLLSQSGREDPTDACHRPAKSAGANEDDNNNNARQKSRNEDPDARLKQADSKKRQSRWKCCDCGKEFSQLRNYKYHRSVHEGTGEFGASCPVCGKQLKDRGYLSSHMKIHQNRKEYGCLECGARFNQRVAYNVHSRAHAALKPHRCEQCGKSFGRKTLLRQHLRSHSGERPYACPQCRKAFTDRSNMALHARLVHSGLRPHRCSLCPKAFGKKHHLKIHLNCHTGSKPYACPYCALGFSQSSNMRTHAKKCNRANDQ